MFGPVIAMAFGICLILCGWWLVGGVPHNRYLAIAVATGLLLRFLWPW